MPYPNYGQAAYKSMPRGGNPRETEAWALTEAARRMSLVQKAGVPVEDMLVAVRLNWRLWTIFQAEISSPESPLPLEMRRDMLALCNFVDRRTVDIISKPEASKLDTLININRQIAAGLFVHPAEAAGEAGEVNPQPAATGTTNDVV